MPIKGTRVNEYRQLNQVEGLLMTNPSVGAGDPMQGSFVLAVLPGQGARTTYWRGWPRGRWWNSPMLFWDAFSRDGELLNEPAARNGVGALCQQKSIPAGGSATFHILARLALSQPHAGVDRMARTQGRRAHHHRQSLRRALQNGMGCRRVCSHQSGALESRTRLFADLSRQHPARVVKEAAGANLSTLVQHLLPHRRRRVSRLRRRHDKLGCCHGNCTHVWNYETSTAFLLPSLAHSLRKAAFGYSMDDAGAMHFRQSLPDGKDRSGFAAADGQMGQIMHAYLDWVLSGDEANCADLWPRVKKGLEFAWVPGGWDANRDGVLEGVQHNTYDVEFYGPNPLCGVFYLGGLRAAEEMARAAGDTTSADEYRRLFENGSRWIDANLFNGEYYVQKVRGFKPNEIASNLRSDMGARIRNPAVPGRRRLSGGPTSGTVSRRCRRARTVGFAAAYPENARFDLSL